jgi:hypothetical protein
MLSCLYISPSRKCGTSLLVALGERRVHSYKPNPHTALHDPPTPVRICRNPTAPSFAQDLASARICMRKLMLFGWVFGYFQINHVVSWINVPFHSFELSVQSLVSTS